MYFQNLLKGSSLGHWFDTKHLNRLYFPFCLVQRIPCGVLWRPETKLDLLDSFVLQSWALIDPSVYPVNGLSQLLHPGLFFHLLSPFPQVISFDAFSPSKSTIGHVAVNDGQAQGLRRRETTHRVWGTHEFLSSWAQESEPAYRLVDWPRATTGTGTCGSAENPGPHWLQLWVLRSEEKYFLDGYSKTSFPGPLTNGYPQHISKLLTIITPSPHLLQLGPALSS